MGIKVTKGDSFVWLTISREAAVAIFKNEDIDVGPIFKLYDDDSEGEVKRMDDIRSHGGEFGIEVESLSNIMAMALAKWECPACGGKIEKSKMYTTIWECTKCDEEYTLSELLK